MAGQLPVDWPYLPDVIVGPTAGATTDQRLMSLAKAIQDNQDAMARAIGTGGAREISGSVASDGTAANAVPAGSFSATRLGTGSYRLTWTAPFASAAYAVVLSSGNTSAAVVSKQANGTSRTTTQYDVNVFNTVSGSLADGAFEFIARG